MSLQNLLDRYGVPAGVAICVSSARPVISINSLSWPQ